MAPMPMPTAGTSARPGRCDSSTPPTAPMKMAGNVGPPRKPLMDTLYAMPFMSRSSARAPTP